MVEHRISQAAKNKNKKQWYKENIKEIERFSYGEANHQDFFGDRKRNKIVNYELMNNRIYKEDYEHVTQPWGDSIGELPAKMANRDITSSKVKAVLGIEYKRPFPWKAVAVNQDATTKREQETFNRLKQYVIQSLLNDESPEETPYEILKYMEREYQDPEEVMANQLLEFIVKKDRIKDKFNDGFRHAAIAAQEVYHLTIINGHPTVRVVNPVYFDHDRSPDTHYIEDGEWALYEFRMTPTDVIKQFGDELTNAEKKRVYEMYRKGLNNDDYFFDYFDFWEDSYVRVIHCTWKSLRKIGFLTYLDMQGVQQERIVSENYRVNKEQGDISIEWKWIPEVHEGYKIGTDIFVGMGPIPNQHKDLDNIYEAKLPYYGAAYDHENSRATSLVDRIKPYQYLYNILMYRMELLVASDKGRKAFINIGAVPRSAGIDLKEFEYYMEANQYTYLNPNEEGNRFGNIGELVKEIDLSNTSDISKYVNLLEYVEERAGTSIGVTKQLEGQIQAREAVSNVQQSISLSTNILEQYFQRHDAVKRNVLQGLLELSKLAYATGDKRVISFVLDDMSVASLTLDPEMLDSTTYGVFIADASKMEESKQVMMQLAHAAMQAGQNNLSTMLKVVQADTTKEAEEIMLVGEKQMQAQQQRQAQEEHQRALELIEAQKQAKREEHQMELEKIRLEEELKYKREIAGKAVMALGFTQEDDINQNRTPDPLDAAELLLEREKIAASTLSNLKSQKN